MSSVCCQQVVITCGVSVELLQPGVGLTHVLGRPTAPAARSLLMFHRKLCSMFTAYDFGYDDGGTLGRHM